MSSNRAFMIQHYHNGHVLFIPPRLPISLSQNSTLHCTHSLALSSYCTPLLSLSLSLFFLYVRVLNLLSLSLSLSLSLTYIYIYESLVNLAAVLLATLHFLVSNLKPNFFHSHSSFSYTLLSLSFFFFGVARIHIFYSNLGMYMTFL